MNPGRFEPRYRDLARDCFATNARCMVIEQGLPANDCETARSLVREADRAAVQDLLGTLDAARV